MTHEDAPVIEPATRYQPPPGPVMSAERSVFVPLCLLAVAVVGWLGFQTVQLAVERGQIAQVRAAVEAQAQNASKLRASLDAVAASTAKLASDGNANARVIVEELRKRGITINPTAAAPKPP